MNNNVKELFAPCYRNVVSNSIFMMKRQEFKKIVVMASGRASGKSQVTFDIIIMSLPFFENDDCMIVVYNVRHKVNTLRLLRTKLKNHGYYHFKERTGEDGEKILLFGNNNSITVTSIKANSKEEEREKMKTSINYNYENGGVLRYLVLEEWTAIIDVYDNYLDANNAISSFGRLFPTRLDLDDKYYSTFYIYNPPANRQHNVYPWKDFIQEREPLNVNTTILDLPEKWQSQEDLEIIKSWEKMGNHKAIQHYYYGIPSLTGGLAYNIDYKVLITEDEADKLQFTDYQIFVDNGSKDATTFVLYGKTIKGNVIALDVFYHSGRETGQRKPFSEYAEILANSVHNLPVNIKHIVTDSLIFTDELKKHNINSQFIEKKNIENMGFREACYDFSCELVNRKRFYIVDKPNNHILYEQIKNAETDLRGNRIKMKRPNNENTPEEKQVHTCDTFSYYCYFNSKELLGRKA